MKRTTEISRAPQISDCIDDCLDCFAICRETVDHCLKKGAEHAAPEHIRVLLDCSALCQLSADFMLRGSVRSPRLCEVCAETCDACAASCERFDDPVMGKCAEVCRRCADSCRAMAGSYRQAA